MHVTEEKRLKADSLGSFGQFFQSLSHVAPAAGTIMTVPYMASRAGAATPLAFAFALVLALLLAYCLTLLTRKYYGASGYFQIHSRALGAKAGFTTSWLFLLYEPFNACATFFGFGVLVLEPFTQAHFGVTVPWWVGLIIGNIVVTTLAVIRAKFSVLVTAALGALEFIIMLALGVLLVTKANLPLQPQLFSPASSADGFGGLMFAFIFGFMAFIGYESGLPLSEETKNPGKSNAYGMLGAVLLCGVFFTFIGYASVVGFGGFENSARFAQDFSTAVNPYGTTLAQKAFGNVGEWFLFFAILNSVLACCLATHNSATRVIFSLGRAGILPSWLGKTTKEDQVPRRAALAMGSFTFFLAALYAVLSRGSNLVEWFGLLGVMAVLPLLIIHFVTCISVYIAYRYHHAEDFHGVHHGVLPLVTAAFTLLPIGGTIFYNLTPPFSYAPWVVAVWFVVGLAVYAWLKAVRPEALKSLESEMELLAHSSQK